MTEVPDISDILIDQPSAISPRLLWFGSLFFKLLPPAYLATAKTYRSPLIIAEVMSGVFVCMHIQYFLKPVYAKKVLHTLVRLGFKDYCIFVFLERSIVMAKYLA